MEVLYTREGNLIGEEVAILHTLTLLGWAYGQTSDVKCNF